MTGKEEELGLEVNVHAAQTSILRELLFCAAAGFAQLRKPTGLSSDHFAFHIGRLVELGLVEREEAGQYRLTARGKEYANRLDTDDRTIERQGKVAVLVVARRKRLDGQHEYMVQKRLKQPYYGFYGFMTGKLRWGETVEEGAARELKEETGLKGDLTVKAVYHKMDYTAEGTMLEDKHFYVVLADDARGDFVAMFEGGENYWYTLSEVSSLDNAFAGMDSTAELVNQPEMMFRERRFTYQAEDY